MPKDSDSLNNRTAKAVEPEAPPSPSGPDAKPITAPASAVKPLGAGEPCPECGGSLIPESGCFRCRGCGYGACG